MSEERQRMLARLRLVQLLLCYCPTKASLLHEEQTLLERTREGWAA